MASFGKWLKDSIASTLGFSSGAHGKAVLLGLDAAGKTTFLYRAKSRSTEVDTFIPTIGFNVETVVVARTDVTCWDVGGCDKIRPLWQHYFRDAQVLVYFVDSNDIDRMEEARNELKYFLDMSEKKLPLLVVANKQDLPRALNTWEVIRTLELDRIQDRVWNIMGMIATNGTGVPEAVQWISAAAKGQAPPLQCTAEDIDRGIRKDNVVHLAIVEAQSQAKPDLAETLVRVEVRERKRIQNNEAWAHWLARPDDDDDDVFLQKCADYSLDIWDHYTHVRMGFLFLRRHGEDDGLREVSRAIQDYITHSDRTSGKSFHPTMTAFWVRMIVYWMRRCSREQEVAWETLQFKPLLQFISTAQDDFTNIVDRGLFYMYYTIMFSPEARQGIVPPDLRPLPV